MTLFLIAQHQTGHLSRLFFLIFIIISLLLFFFWKTFYFTLKFNLKTYYSYIREAILRNVTISMKTEKRSNLLGNILFPFEISLHATI